MTRKPRFTQYEMNRYVEVQNLRTVTAESATGSQKYKDLTYIPYTPDEIKVIVELRKEAGKPLLTQNQIIKISGSLGKNPNDPLIERAKSNPVLAARLWKEYYNKHINTNDNDVFHRWLFSGVFAEEGGSLKDANTEPGFCARCLAWCDPLRTG